MTSTVRRTTTVDAKAAAEQLLLDRVPGWSLPGSAYTDADLFAADLAAVFGTGWLFLGASAALPEGSSQVWTVGGESVIVSRDADGLHASANVCAHRGSRLVDDDGVRPLARIVCPYHSWAYRADGTLAGAPFMGPGFTTSDHRLALVAVRDLEGLLFVSLEHDPDRRAGLDAGFDAMAAAVGPHLAPYRLRDTQVAASETYRVQANWKTITENNRECYHCRGNHPEFCLTNFEFGVAGDPRSNAAYEAAVQEQTASWQQQGLPTHTVNFPEGLPFRVARLPLKDGCVTESMTGQRVAPLLGDVSERSGSLRVIGLPSMWIHVNCDYAMLTRVTPVDAHTTDVEVTYLVSADARPGQDFDRHDVTAVWALTSTQDWELSERNQRGQSSRAYRPGVLSTVTESSLATFHDWYLARLGAYAGA